MLQLIPGKNFNIIRQLDNVNDTNVYYVQAVVRNAATDAVLATVNLTSKGNQRFSSPYQVPADTSGTGMYISITSSVYTDSGYTQLSQTYATEDAEYLVLQPAISTYGNGGTTIVDYDKIRKFISDIKFPGIPTYDKDFKSLQKYNDERFGEVKSHIEKTVKGIKMPSYDDAELRSTIASLQNEMSAMRKSHENSIRLLSQAHSASINGLQSHHEETMKMMNERLSKIADRPYAAERDRDTLSMEHESLKKDYNSLAGVIKSVQLNGKYEDVNDKKDKVDMRVKKLLGI